MQTLKLAEDIFDALETGKQTTIRKGRRDIQLGDLKLESVEENRQEIVNVINVHYCRLANVYIGDLQNDGFKRPSRHVGADEEILSRNNI